MRAYTVGTAAKILLLILGKSWRISRIRPSSGLMGNSTLYAFWHGVQLPLIYTHRKMGIRIIISNSRDGSLASSIVEKMGFSTVRGSSSKGGTSAARDLIEAMKAGYCGAITPDGPKGPYGLVKRGVSLIPRRAGVPLVPYGVDAFPAIRLRSWDRFLIPLPFSKVVLSEGRPIPPEDCSEATLNSAIRAETSRARLLTNPFSGIIIFLLKTAAYLLTPLAKIVLLFRPDNERRERNGLIKAHTGKPVWLHGSSLGELKGLLPIIGFLKKADIPFHVTCSTPAAREYISKEKLPGSFLPIETPWAVRRFLDTLTPSSLILAETEFWPILLHETVSRGITAGMINARLSVKSVKGYKLIKPLFLNILSCFRGILTRSELDSERFARLGVDTELGGDAKAAVKPSIPDPLWEKRIKRGPRGVLVAGSTRKGEEEIILNIARETGLTPVIVPRHTGRISDILQSAKSLGFNPDLWSNSPSDSTCLIVDEKGILSSLYALADIAFVGGTLVPVGGHNILEPLACGIPVVVGPEHFHFTEVVNQSSAADICRVFSSVEEGASAVVELLNMDRKSSILTSTSSRDFVILKMKELLSKMEIQI